MNRPVVLVVAALSCACAGGSETGNPVLSVDVALSAHSSDLDRVAIGEDTAAVVVDEAWVAVDAVAFLDDEACARLGDDDDDDDDGADEDDVRAGAPVSDLAADLAQRDTTVRVEFTPAGHCGLRIGLSPFAQSLPSGAPARLRDHSIVLRGRRSDGVSFVLAHPEREQLDLLAVDGDIEVTGRLLLSFDLARWMAGVTLEDATVADDGSIYIDVDRNAALWQRFDANLACGLRLYADEDAGGTVGEGDRLLGRCASE